MNSKAYVLKKYSKAVVLTRDINGKTQYRISPEPLRYATHIPHGGFLSGWCQNEDRAWWAAIQKMGHKQNNYDGGW